MLPPVIWGFFAIPLRNLTAYPAEQILYYRMFSSLAMIALFVLVFRRRQLLEDWNTYRSQDRRTRRVLALLIVASVLALTGNWLSYIYVVNRVSLQAAAFAYMVCPILTALCGYFLLRESINARKWLAIFISFLSVLILAWGFLEEVAWSVGIALLFAFYLVIQRRIAQFDKLNLLGLQLLLATFLVLPAFLWQYTSMPPEPAFWINILSISLFFTVIPLFLNLYALIRIPSSTVGILIYINPIVAFAVAFMYFGEKASPLQVFSYSVLLCAVVLFNWAYFSRLKRKPEE